MQDDIETAYLLRREAIHRDMAGRAIDPAIQAIHRRMADQYAERAAPVLKVR